MKKVEYMSIEELESERSLYRLTLIPAYIIAMVITVCAIWFTSFGNAASLIFMTWIVASLPVTLRSSKVHRALR